MRILIFALHFKPEVGGVGEYTHHLADRLERLGQDVLVVAESLGDASEDGFDRAVDYGIERIPAHLTRDKKDFGEYVQLSWKVFQKIREFDPDALVINYIVPNAPCRITATLAKLKRVPAFLMAYGEGFYERHRPSFSWTAKRWYTLSLVDHIFAISSYTEELVSEYCMDRSKISVVNPGVDVEKWSGFEASSENPVHSEDAYPLLLSVGRLVRHKGFDQVIRSLTHIRDDFQNLHYYIVGEGPYQLELKSLVDECDLQDRVTFTGYLSERQKMAFYNEADIFLMPSREGEMVEGFGITFLEANLFGTPVIAGRSGGTRDAVVHDETGFLVNPNRPRDIAASVRKLADDPDLRDAMGEMGRRRVVEEYDWTSRARMILDRIESTVGVSGD